MSIPVIVAYRPKPGKEKDLDELMEMHVEKLREYGLATDRAPVLMKSSNGTVIEVFEWKSKEALESAHTNPDILKMWGEYEKVCEYTPLSELPESSQVFAEFKDF